MAWTLIGAVFIAAATLCLPHPCSATEPKDRITVKRVKIVVDDHRYVWEDKKRVPARHADGITEPATIISHLAFAPGDQMTPEALERAVRRAQGRLLATNDYYSVSAVVLPPRKSPETRTVLIRLQEGFTYHFGGGYAYGFFGKDNLRGRRQYFAAAVGYNLTGATFVNESVADTPLILGAECFYTNSGPAPAEITEFHRVDTRIRTGLRFHPDWVIGLDVASLFVNHTTVPAGLDADYFGDARRAELLLSPSLTYQFAADNEPISSGVRITARLDLYLPVSGGVRAAYLLQAVGKKTLAKGHSLNLQLSHGRAFAPQPYMEKFDIYSGNDFAIRSGQDQFGLMAEQIAMANFEYRIHFVGFFIPPFFDVDIDGFVFADAGWAAAHDEPLFGGGLLDAFGAGLRLNLNSPVFTYFSFSYGWSHQGSGRFVFTGTAGF